VRLLSADVHLEGMGWQGAALATLLDRAGVPFTWHDIDAEHRAWPACTGIVYPGGDERTATCHEEWGVWASGGLFPEGTVTVRDYVYTTKAAPHASKVKPRADLGTCRVHGLPAFQVDVPTIVRGVRERHAGWRTDGPRTDAAVYVEAHGFTRRLGTWVWGWTVPVRIDVTDPGLDAAAPAPTFYGRKGRFVMAYAYAIPGRPGWYWAGSSLIGQKTPHALDVERHYTRWARQFADLFPGLQVTAREAPLVGWRPRAATGDSERVETRVEDGRRVITVPPLWHSGVRWAPSVTTPAWMKVMAALR